MRLTPLPYPILHGRVLDIYTINGASDWKANLIIYIYRSLLCGLAGNIYIQYVCGVLLVGETVATFLSSFLHRKNIRLTPVVQRD